MSAPRPRPVTAKVRRPLPAGTYRAKKNVDLLSDSTGSTESLISCIDEDELSSVNRGDSETSHALTSQRSGVSRSTDSNTNNNNRETLSETSFSNRIISEKSALTSVTETESTEEIGPWEKWMIKKTESMKKLSQQKSQLERQRKKLLRQQELEKQEKEMKAERLRKEWLEHKNEERAKAERRQMLRERRKRHEEEAKKQKIEEASQRKYHEWLEQKKKTDALRHALEIEQQKLKELELSDKKEKSDAAFKSWLEKSFQRAKTIPSSYAKSDGAITGYYNSAANPSPSFYNPLPWQPVVVPQRQTRLPKSKKTKGKRKTRQNAWAIDI
ncbi:coiled-coil domain-containing protein 34-like [Watersipora subatra]|uniref:coiled-coil domain-containing protein 34-like n=1 Tax=Watersipora subatra TaxID=2589382 RepID=UPI00355C4B1B